MKKCRFAALIAAVLILSMGFLGCGGGGNNDPVPVPLTGPINISTPHHINVNITATYGGAETGVSLQWFRVTGQTSTAITPASNVLNTATPGDFFVRATRDGSLPFDSANISVIDPTLPNVDGAVTITGELFVGQTLTANWTGTTANATFQWFLDGTSITNATGTTHVAAAAGSYTVQVSAPNHNPITSPAVTVIMADVDGTVTITGVLESGETLTANWTGTTANATFQWFLDGEPITNATGTTHVAAVGGSYTVQVSAPNHNPITSPAVTVVHVHDVIIVGSGITGFSAFFKLMIDGDDLDVLFLEKNPMAGGLTLTSGGMMGHPDFLGVGHTAPIPHGTPRTRSWFEMWYGIEQMRGGTGAYPNTVLHPATNNAHTPNTIRTVGGTPIWPNFDKLFNVSHRALAARLLVASTGVDPTGSAHGGGGVGAGRGLIRAMNAHANTTWNNGNDVVTLNARVTDLIMQGTGAEQRVVGVRYTLNGFPTGPGTQHEARGRKVLMATGAFGDNPEMLRQMGEGTADQDAVYLENFVVRAHLIGDGGSDGSGIAIMIRDAGAAPYLGGFGASASTSMGRAWTQFQLPIPGGGLAAFGEPFSHLQASGFPNDGTTGRNDNPFAPRMTEGDGQRSLTLLVDGDGRRFRDELQMNTGRTASILQIRNRPGYWVVWSSDPHHVAARNTVRDQSAHEWWLPQARILAQNEPAIAEVFRAGDTLADLAMAIWPTDAAARATFINTVNEFDAAAATALGGGAWVDPHATGQVLDNPHVWVGAARPAGTDNANIKRFATGPFFAARLFPAGWDVFGGVRSDNYTRVIRADGTVITGLYAAGGASNRSLFGQFYVGGSSVTIYPGHGYLAGLTILQDIAASSP